MGARPPRLPGKLSQEIKRATLARGPRGEGAPWEAALEARPPREWLGMVKPVLRAASAKATIS